MAEKIDLILNRVYGSEVPDHKDLVYLLSVSSQEELQRIFDFADRVRREFVGDGILLRGIIEFSNYCRNSCLYCGLNKTNKSLKRYRLSGAEIQRSVRRIVGSGIQTVVLQSGEDHELEAGWLKEIIQTIKSECDIAVTLSVGERDIEDYRMWRYAGADRYLLKIESSDRRLYQSLHPGMSFDRRKKCLKELKDLGYQTGSGNIIGLRGQALSHLAGDILFFEREKFDMIGIGPFIPHPDTELSKVSPGDVLMTLKTLALTRIVTKNTHLPATTALASVCKEDLRGEGLKAGANVVMLNFTPEEYRPLYQIYPNKRCIGETVDSCKGWNIDYSRGDSMKLCGKQV